MAAPEDGVEALALDAEHAEAPTLLDALARTPAAAALVVAALDRLEDRKALRLAHTQLRDAVGEATTKLILGATSTARPPTARRWPRLEELTLSSPNLAALEALGAETWAGLRALNLGNFKSPTALDEPCATALAAALRRMPALRALELWAEPISDEAAAELFGAWGAAPGLRCLTIVGARLKAAATHALAASGWRLEELELRNNYRISQTGLDALVAAPPFALRRLVLTNCVLNDFHLRALANSRCPLEELDLSGNVLRSAAVGRPLAALSRHASLRRLGVSFCHLSAANFKALIEATWPALTVLSAPGANVAFAGPHALGAAAFAGLPALEELDLSQVPLGEAGARLLASQRWARLRVLRLSSASLGHAGAMELALGAWPALEQLYLSGNFCGTAGLAALAHGEWPALERLDLRFNNFSAPLALEDARRWAPALVDLLQ